MQFGTDQPKFCFHPVSFTVQYNLHNNPGLTKLGKETCSLSVFEGGEMIVSFNVIVDKLEQISHQVCIFTLIIPCSALLFLGIFGQLQNLHLQNLLQSMRGVRSVHIESKMHKITVC